MTDQPKRRNPPAFQLYADDFIAGTADMAPEEVGAYIRLLCHQWNRGSIPVEPERQQRLAGGSVSVAVLAKFPAGPDGMLRNERLEQVRAASDSFRQKQAEKGRISAEKRKQANNGATVVPTAVPTVVQPEAQPKTQPEANSPSPSPSPDNRDTSVSLFPLTPIGGRDSVDPMESIRLRIGGWFNRRPTTQWTEKETKALRAVIALKTPPEDLDLLETRYRSGNPYLRRDILTLLNNWNTEIDRAKNTTANHGNNNNPQGNPVPHANSVLQQRNAIMGPGIDAHIDDALRRSAEIDRRRAEAFEKDPSDAPFGEFKPKVSSEGPGIG